MLLEKPKDNDLDDYDLVVSQGKNIYVDCRVVTKDDTLGLDLKKILFVEKYVVSGIMNA